MVAKGGALSRIRYYPVFTAICSPGLVRLDILEGVNRNRGHGSVCGPGLYVLVEQHPANWQIGEMVAEEDQPSACSCSQDT